MSANQDTYPVEAMCRLLEVSKSGFYAQEDRALSNHARQDVELRALIYEIYEHCHRTYGSRRGRIQSVVATLQRWRLR